MSFIFIHLSFVFPSLLVDIVVVVVVVVVVIVVVVSVTTGKER